MVAYLFYHQHSFLSNVILAYFSCHSMKAITSISITDWHHILWLSFQSKLHCWLLGNVGPLVEIRLSIRPSINSSTVSVVEFPRIFCTSPSRGLPKKFSRTSSLFGETWSTCVKWHSIVKYKFLVWKNRKLLGPSLYTSNVPLVCLRIPHVDCKWFSIRLHDLRGFSWSIWKIRLVLTPLTICIQSMISMVIPVSNCNTSVKVSLYVCSSRRNVWPLQLNRAHVYN